jgi:signal transduction histidine kinase
LRPFLSLAFKLFTALRLRLPIPVYFYKCIALYALLAAFSQTVFAAPPLTDTVDYYNKLVLRYRYDNPDSAVYFANIGFNLARKLKSLPGQALMLNQLGMIDDNIGQYEASRKKYLKAFELYKLAADTKGMATENIRLGVVELRKGQYDKAIDYFLRSLDLSQRNGNLPGQMESYITLGEAYAGQKRYTEAIGYYHTAEGINKRVPFSNLSLNLYNDIGIAYRETGKFAEAKPYLLKGIKQSDVPRYQGLNITLTNTLASIYAKQGDLKTSISLQRSALAKARKINNYIRQVQTLTGLATTYGKAHADSSLFYWKQALQLSASKNAYKEQVDELNAIADIYEYKQDYKAAYIARKQQYHLADDFFYKKMSKQIISLQDAFELNQSKARVQELRFANNKQVLERKIILIVLAGIITILIIFAFFYFQTRQLNRLLHKINDELQESNTVKDKLFSVLGHDLRSPFISVLNLLQIIDEDLEPEQRKQIRQSLEVTTTASLETLDSLLRWGQMQIKGIPLNQIALKIKSPVERTVIFLSGVADSKGIKMINTVDADTTVTADADHFEFIIRNLLSNAIKFSKPGGQVLINAATSNNQVAITVSDSGIGMEPEKLKNIFKLGTQSTRGTGNESGTGLGLLLCKEFVEINGGTIAAESKPGEGSAFTITLKKA